MLKIKIDINRVESIKVLNFISFCIFFHDTTARIIMGEYRENDSSNSPVIKFSKFNKITSKGFLMNFKSLLYVCFRKKKFTKISLGEQCQKSDFPRWPPSPYMKSYFQDNLTYIVDRNVMLVSKHMFSGSKNLNKYILSTYLQCSSPCSSAP